MVRDHGDTATAVRRVAATVAFAFFLFWSFFLASWIGWSFQPKGWPRVADNVPLLVAAAISGVLAVVTARAILRRRLFSVWLLLALPVPLLVVLDEGLGVLGL